jgi:competence protein ComGC
MGKKTGFSPLLLILLVVASILLVFGVPLLSKQGSASVPTGRIFPTPNTTSANGTEGQVALFENATSLVSSPNLTYNETDGLRANGMITANDIGIGSETGKIQWGYMGSSALPESNLSLWLRFSSGAEFTDKQRNNRHNRDVRRGQAAQRDKPDRRHS